MGKDKKSKHSKDKKRKRDRDDDSSDEDRRMSDKVAPAIPPILLSLIVCADSVRAASCGGTPWCLSFSSAAYGALSGSALSSQTPLYWWD